MFTRTNRLSIGFWLALSMLLLLAACQKTPTKDDDKASPNTSHQFHWQQISFEQLTPDIITIVDKDDIWIAGISSGTFSALHWNGKTLVKEAIYDPMHQQVKKYFSDFFAFSANDFYFVDGNVFHFDGQNSQTLYIRDYNRNEFIQTLWMENPGDIYAAGRKALIHFDGHEWHKTAIEGDDPVVDIWGAYPSPDSKAMVLGLISPSAQLGAPRLITLSKGSLKDTLNLPDDIPARNLWFSKQSPIYVQGKDLWQHVNGHWKQVVLDGTNLNAISGSAQNNIFVVGEDGYAAHFNGATWQSYPQLKTVNGAFESVCVKGNVVAMAGRSATHGFLVIGSK